MDMLSIFVDELDKVAAGIGGKPIGLQLRLAGAPPAAREGWLSELKALRKGGTPWNPSDRPGKRGVLERLREQLASHLRGERRLSEAM